MCAQHYLDGFLLNLREERAVQDIAIADEVIGADCYRLRQLHAVMPRLKTILDVGGHIGCFGLFAKSLWPEAHLVAVEPNEASAHLYRENLDANGFEGATVVHAGLAYDRRRHVLLDGERSTGGCVLVDEEEADRICSRARNDVWERYHRLDDSVPLVTLEDLRESFDLDEISLLKLDCEGSELEICDRVSRTCATGVRMMVGEYHIEGGFELFAKLARQAFPQLYFFGGGTTSIGPFFAFPTLRMAYTFFAVGSCRKMLRRVKKVWLPESRIETEHSYR